MSQLIWSNEPITAVPKLMVTIITGEGALVMNSLSQGYLSTSLDEFIPKQSEEQKYVQSKAKPNTHRKNPKDLTINIEQAEMLKII